MGLVIFSEYYLLFLGFLYNPLVKYLNQLCKLAA